MLGGGALAATLEPPGHLQQYYEVVAQDPEGTPSIAQAFIEAFGPLKALLGAIAGVGVAIAITQYARSN